MKLRKKKDCNNSVRIVFNDNNDKLGVLGTVEDLLKENILTYCDYNPNTFCFIPFTSKPAIFQASRQELIDSIKSSF